MTTNGTEPWRVARPSGAVVGGSRPPEQDLLLRGVRLPRSGPADPPGTIAAEGLDEHLARLGARPGGSPVLADALESAGLTGHGGGHVPTALKWRSALRAGQPLTVVANGAESEPISAKDATLMRQRPHLVLDGLALASEALGARRAVVWLHGDDRGSRLALETALTERRGAGLAGPVMEVVAGPVHYLAGESTAIAAALVGRPALPTSRRPRAAGEAVPRTLVQNVETLARVALVARGLENPQVSLLTVLGPHDRQVLQVPQAARFADVLAAAGVLRSGRPQAVLLGGFGGTWAQWSEVEGLAVEEFAVRRAGLSLGAGVVAPVWPGACGVAEVAVVATYLAAMSARQCGPCMFGLPALAEDLRRLAARARTASRPWAARRRPRCRSRAWRLPPPRRRDAHDRLRAHRLRCRRRGPPTRPVVRGRRSGHRSRAGRGLVTGRPPAFRLRVDPIACEAVGLCAHLAGAVVDLDRWGYPILAAGDLAPGDVTAAERAVRACPRRALWIDGRTNGG